MPLQELELPRIHMIGEGTATLGAMAPVVQHWTSHECLLADCVRDRIASPYRSSAPVPELSFLATNSTDFSRPEDTQP